MKKWKSYRLHSRPLDQPLPPVLARVVPRRGLRCRFGLGGGGRRRKGLLSRRRNRNRRRRRGFDVAAVPRQRRSRHRRGARPPARRALCPGARDGAPSKDAADATDATAGDRSREGGPKVHRGPPRLGPAREGRDPGAHGGVARVLERHPLLVEAAAVCLVDRRRRRRGGGRSGRRRRSVRAGCVRRSGC